MSIGLTKRMVARLWANNKSFDFNEATKSDRYLKLILNLEFIDQ